MTEKLKFFISLTIMMVFVGFYQISQIQDKINHYGIEVQIPDSLLMGKDIQFQVEKQKMVIEGLLLNKENDKKVVENLKELKSEELITTTKEGLNIKEPVIANKNNDLPVISNSKKKCIENCKVLMVGDSVMGDLFYSVNRFSKKQLPGWTIINGHKVSSGLSNKTYYDWPLILKTLMQTHTPDYVVVLLGTNDAQGISDEGKSYRYGTNSWSDIYEKRTKEMLSDIGETSYLWIEIPQVGLTEFNKKLETVSSIHKKVVGENFLSTKDLLLHPEHPQFKDFRQADGIHLNAKASDKLAEEVIKKLKTN